MNSSKRNFLFFEILRFDLLMAIFRLLGVFCYISFVNFERVCRPNQKTQILEICYMGSLYGHKLIPEISYQYFENNFRFCAKNLNYYKDSHVEILVNIICDLTKYRHFLNRNLSLLGVSLFMYIQANL